MTCDDFRKANSRGINGILALTRAERSACAQHWVNCFECRDWSNTIVFAITQEQELQVELTRTRDRSDPETYRPTTQDVVEMLEKFDLDVKKKQETTQSRKDP